MSNTEPNIDPTDLTVEALEPVSLSFKDRLNQAKSDPNRRIVIDNSSAPPKRGPGRPRKDPITDEDVERKRAERIANDKRKKVDEYTDKVINEWNEEIMRMLIDMGVPPNFLYKSGAPPTTVANTKFTETGNMLAIKPQQARRVSRFVVELEYTDSGNKIAKALAGTQSGSIGLLIYGVLAGYSVFQYARTMETARRNLEPLLKAKRMVDAQAKVKEQQNNG